MTRTNLPISYLKPDGTWRNDEDRLLCAYCGRLAQEFYTICVHCKTPFNSATIKYLKEKFPEIHGPQVPRKEG